MSDSALECYLEGTEGDLLQCALQDLAVAAGGQTVLGLLVGSVVILTLYIAGDGDPATPTVATILLGGALVPLLPPHLTYLAWAIVVLGLAFGVMAIGSRWVFRGQF